MRNRLKPVRRRKKPAAVELRAVGVRSKARADRRPRGYQQGGGDLDIPPYDPDMSIADLAAQARTDAMLRMRGKYHGRQDRFLGLLLHGRLSRCLMILNGMRRSGEGSAGGRRDAVASRRRGDFPRA